MLKKSDSLHNVTAIGLLVLFIIGFTILKWDYFGLPFYWDEAWSYAKAVFNMYENGPTLNPTQVDQEIFRGHPLFFYFLTSALAHLSGWSLTAMHVWMLLLSLLGVVGFYFVVKQWLDSNSALIACAVLLASEMFFIQSSMLLPEVLIAFLFIFSIHFFLARKFLWYFITATVLVLTKESGLMLFPALGLYVIWEAILQKKKFKSFIIHAIIYLSPFFVFFVFMLVQKVKWGWYVFPEHVGYMNYSLSNIYGKLKEFVAIIFTQEGRVVSSCISLFVILFLFIKNKFKQNWTAQQKSILVVCCIFSICYAFFTAINFYSQRYLLSLLPMYALAIGALLFRLKSFQVYKQVLSVCIVVIGLIYYTTSYKSSQGDVSQGSRDMTRLHQAVINDFVLAKREANFNVGFLLSEYLQYPEMGYVHQRYKGIFKLSYIQDADYMIKSSINDMEGETNYNKENGKPELVYENELNNSWIKVYKTNY